MSLQAKLDAFKADFESGKPPYNAPRAVIEIVHHATAELIATGAASRTKKAGDIAPSAREPNGDVLNSGELLRRGPLILTFYRGAWCPYCNMELRALQAVKAQFDKYGASLIAISPHRVIAVSLRHFYPDHWDSVGDTYSIAQHVDDLIAFIGRIDPNPVGLMGHSQRPRLVSPRATAAGSVAQADPRRTRRRTRCQPRPRYQARVLPAGAAVRGVGREDRGRSHRRRPSLCPRRLAAAAGDAQAMTPIGQVRDSRSLFSKMDAEAIKTPTLFVGGANTKGTLSKVLRTLAAHVKESRTEMIPGATHPMFEQAPQKYCAS
jgi:pimeloyl-ACP methyl ester carboxylesterase